MSDRLLLARALDENFAQIVAKAISLPASELPSLQQHMDRLDRLERKFITRFGESHYRVLERANGAQAA